MKKHLGILTLVVIAAFGLCSNADATLTFNLGIANPAIAGYPGPYGTVRVDLVNATMAVVRFDHNHVGPFTYLFGDGGMVAINVNASFFNVSPPSQGNIYPGFNPGPVVDTGPGNEDGFGSFNLTLDNFDGYTHTATYVELILQNMGGTWASENDVLVANPNGFRAAAHIFVAPNYPPDPGSGALATGFATEGGNSVPEPTSMLLLGLGLAGYSVARRRKKN